MVDKFSGGWQGVLNFPIGGRQQKPRKYGLSMIIDKGLGPTGFRDLLAVASPYIDFIKLGFGTSALYPTIILKEKIRLAREYNIDIYPGGTFFEVAILQGRLNTYLQTAKELGYTFIEISDGTIDLNRNSRLTAICRAREEGLGVITEVGKKDPREALSEAQLLNQIAIDIEAGADYVIIEGRDSGQNVVIYDNRGNIIEDTLNNLLSGIKNMERIIWEAPRKKQQQTLIIGLGNNVSLGNIQPEDILALEALRTGLRSDTLKSILAKIKLLT